jgi:hypothetical protein
MVERGVLVSLSDVRSSLFLFLLGRRVALAW